MDDLNEFGYAPRPCTTGRIPQGTSEVPGGLGML
jgi:hypothetical protein